MRTTNEQVTLLGLSSKRQEITRVGEDVENRESLCTVGSNINWCSLYGKQYGDSPPLCPPQIKNGMMSATWSLILPQLLRKEVAPLGGKR